MSLFMSLFSRSPPANAPNKTVTCMTDEVIENDFVVLTATQNSSQTVRNPQYYSASAQYQGSCAVQQALKLSQTAVVEPRLSDVHDLPVILSPLLSSHTSLQQLLNDTSVLLRSVHNHTFDHRKYDYDFSNERQVIQESRLQTGSRSRENEVNADRLDVNTDFGFKRHGSFQKTQYERPLITF